MIGDLHCHTRLSDGSMSIDDLVFYAKRAGLDFVAVTDHDTMEGVTRASVLGKRYGIGVVAGTEISCYDSLRGRKVHLLCYLPDKPDRLQGMLGQTLESRAKAGQRMIRAVMRYYPVTEEHIQRYTLGSKSIYKAHIMQALMDLGYDCQPYGELFRHLFDPEKGLCPRKVEYPDIFEALELVHSAGGIAVLAHPPTYGSMELLRELAEKELIHGVEAAHPDIRGEDEEEIARVAEQYGLLKTGGSDFHGMLRGQAHPLAARITTEPWLNALFSFKRKMDRK